MKSGTTYFFSNDSEFENEIRRIARLLWPSAEFAGAVIVAGRERDGVFVTDECVHLLECTTSRKKDKAEEDVKKLFHLSKRIRTEYPLKAIKGWFVTLDEPTADQRSAAEKHPDLVVAVSYDQFRSKLVDARTYLDLRRAYPFGSVRDPDGHPIQDLKFVPLNMVDKASGGVWSLDSLLTAASTSTRVVLLGDYGAGKSSTLREVFFRLATQFWRQEVNSFPILLNLRDHHGQSSPVEALERHGRNITYPNPSHLVRAWRSGYVTLLLDGFDEIATSGWLNQSTKLKQLRFRAMELVRAFVRDTPPSSAVFIAGRQHFFDNLQELRSALGLSDAANLLYLDEFTDAQVQDYLQASGWKGAIPSWLPARPLLLGYLASRNLISSAVLNDPAVNPAVGWDLLLSRICDREARIEAGIDGETIRKIIEKLATRARIQFDGLAPLSSDVLMDVFRSVCGYAPDDLGLILLQRLPGLGVHSQVDGSREFIDQDLVDIARAGDVVEFIVRPYGKETNDLRLLQCPLGNLGVEVCSLKALSACGNSGQISNAIRHAISEGYPLIAADLVRVLIEMKLDYTGHNVYISNVVVPEISLTETGPSLSGLEFQDCMFQRIDLDHNLDVSKLPTFVRCYFGEVHGRMGLQDLPSRVFSPDCVFDSFGESAETTSTILDSTLATGTKVLLTVLKKVYFQRGSGRRESALYRGLDHRARRLVPEVIALLAREGLMLKSKCQEGTLWLPVRSYSVRVQRMLAAPNTTSDPLLTKSATID